MRTALLLITVLCVTACGSSGQPSAGTGTSAKASFSQLLQFSRCMRSHGLPNFPDPSSGGGIQLGLGSNLRPQSPAFQAAQKACHKLLPGGGPGVRRPTRAEFAAALAFARCMRTHGLPHFPDPVASAPSGSGPILALRGMMFRPGPGMDPRSPAFQQAVSRCGVRAPKPPG